MIVFLRLSNRSSFQNIPGDHAARLVERRYELYRRGGSRAAVTERS